MKTTLFTASLVMSCLMLPFLGEAEATTDFSATFNLSARYKDVTCESHLKASGDGVSGGEIDFGAFSSSSGATGLTKLVTLTLDCSNGTGQPETVKVGFSVTSPATVDPDNKNRLYPSADNNAQPQTNLYYDWVWGDKITDTVKKNPASASHKGLNAKDTVDLSGTLPADVYEVSTKSTTGNLLNFPLEITRGVKSVDELEPGGYSAAVTVKVSYE
ncbi:hypothetical protein QL374_003666 [Salmonella enterica]|nr:hypothetical protein [Salmonella enterica]ELW6563316.1 hypothetical protein [Salmonella enterica]ELZ1404535.1 hypothetical protein [Salmonella enterica]